MSDHLKNLHEVLTESAQEPREINSDPMKPYTFRSPEEMRKVAEQICERNGSSLPAFFRQCMRQMIKDYIP
jgi:hypothetical protein